MSFEPIRTADAVDAAWLTAALHAGGIGLDREVVTCSARSIGTGQVGENVRFELAWDEPSPELPASVVGKFPSLSDVSRATAVSVGTYVREIGFYRDLQAAVAIRTPRIHHLGWDDATHDFVLVMEDVCGADQGDQLSGCDLPHAELAIDEAVGLHAPTWGRTDDLRHLDWLGFPDEERTALLSAMFAGTFPGFGERFARRLSSDDLEVGAVLVGEYARLAERVTAWAAETDGWCVTHGDYRLDNMLFACDASAPPLTVVDWQTVAIGTGPSDIAYFCGAGLAPEVRVAHERDLVARYAAGVRAAGVELDDDAAWEGYALGSAGGYLMAVLASQIVEQTERGDEMFAVMAERHAAQVRDVGLLDRLDA